MFFFTHVLKKGFYRSEERKIFSRQRSRKGKLKAFQNKSPWGEKKGGSPPLAPFSPEKRL